MEELGEKELQVLNEIFAKAATDPEFRKTLLKDPGSILERYELSSEAKQSILAALQEGHT